MCLSAGNLSKSLSTLLSDSEYLKNTYNKNAFLLNPEYLKALMICLSAVETNQLSLLHQIENYLYDDLKLKKGHKRSTSQPQIIFSPQKPVQSCTQTKLSRRAHTVEDSVITLANTLKLRPWRSLSNLSYRMEATTRPRSKTVTQQSQAKKVQFSQQTSLPVPCFDYKLEEAKQSQSAIRPITIHHINCEDIQIHEDVSYRNAKKSEDLSEATPSSSATKPVLTPRKSLLSFFDSSAKSSKISNVSKPFKSLNSTSPKDFYFNFLSTPAFGEKLQTKNVLMQAIASDTELRRHSFHSSPRRKVRPNSKKQSLANFIQTIQSSCSSIELDRENAHFLLSEALIGTFEQVKWNQILSQKFELLSKPDKTDRKSSAKIRIGSADSEGSSAGSSYEADNLDSEHLSEAQIEWGASESHSAESIALTLISKFNDQQLPSASEVLWLVSESQAPQKLLPIPDGFVINPDEHYGRNTIIRGTNIWAAPRAQIIFTLQPTLE